MNLMLTTKPSIILTKKNKSNNRLLGFKIYQIYIQLNKNLVELMNTLGR